MTNKPNIMSTANNSTVICVFCGAGAGSTPTHLEAARALGNVLADKDIKLVYGGGTTGMMEEVARTIVARNGTGAVHGIIPRVLIAHERKNDPSYAETQPEEGKTLEDGGVNPVFGRSSIVEDMHTRKNMMAKEVMAGGPGSGFIVSNFVVKNTDVKSHD